MTIRSAEAGDFPAIAAITNHYIRHTPIHFGYEPVTSEELERAWKAGGERYPFVVACDEHGAVVGYAKSGVWRERAAYRDTSEVTVYVAPGLHRRGIGRRAYGELIERCRRAGFHSLLGCIALPNEASVLLHEALGFSLVGVFREVGWKFDTWHDVGFYQLMLQGGGAPGR